MLALAGIAGLEQVLGHPLPVHKTQERAIPPRVALLLVHLPGEISRRVELTAIAWSPLTPFFVCANTDALVDYYTERRARTGLGTPTEDPAKWFVVRPGLPDARIGIRLEMRAYGWARLYMSLDAADATISLSDVYDPFAELVAWGREIDEGDLPIPMEIDEEGKTAVLVVICGLWTIRYLEQRTRSWVSPPGYL